MLTNSSDSVLKFKQEFVKMRNEKSVLDEKLAEMDQRNDFLRSDLKESMINLTKWEVK